jgi:hypothetical protein
MEPIGPIGPVGPIGTGPIGRGAPIAGIIGAGMALMEPGSGGVATVGVTTALPDCFGLEVMYEYPGCAG